MTILPIIYAWLIWLQSSYFNPESIYTLTYKIDERILLLLGMALETGHLLEFGILYLMLIIMLLSYGTLTNQKEWICFFIAMGYGLIDEIHQMFVPYRSFSLIDLLKNVIGITVVWFIIHKSYFVKKGSTLGRRLKHFTSFINQ